MKPKIVLICGPTASGKSELALKTASEMNAEIISADSMQIYKGLDIGTAKPSLFDQRMIRHHLLDVLEITEPLNVYKYVELAENAICEIRGRGKMPILAGGSGMYIRAVLFGLDQVPVSMDLRLRLEAEYEGAAGFEKLRILMSEKDPESFAKWKDHHRRLLRACEVFELTGKSIIGLQEAWNKNIKHEVISCYLSWDREALRRRIEERTDKMLGAGWICEAESMIGRGLLKTPTAWQALGYATIGDFLDGKIDRGTMRTKIVNSTWQLARRQETWFRNKHPDLRIVKMPCDFSSLELSLVRHLES